jgi:signal transduction histidine kinase
MTERLRILAIDDDAVDQMAIRRALEQSELDVELDLVGTTAEADAAVALASVPGGRRYDCLLLDHDLPGETGIDFTRRLRAAGNATPIVFVTGQHDETLLQQAVDAGVTDFFPKHDVSPRRLALRIQFAIRIGSAEAESARLHVAVATASKKRDDILAVVSHDLRGPLHAISLACEALRDELGTAASSRYIGAIERASARAERLIADLLEANAIENGALTLSRERVDAAMLIKQAAAEHELLAKESGGAIEAHVPTDPTLVSADRERVMQVLSNLIGNALKHARGAPIEIFLAQGRGEARISVRDRGPGITDAELPHVFDRYWSGRPKRGGAGLGLAIAKGIVDAHGGKLEVASKLGEGAEFAFTLPLA